MRSCWNDSASVPAAAAGRIRVTAGSWAWRWSSRWAAIAATVFSWNTRVGGSAMPRDCWMRATRRVASTESPPRSKKSSLAPAWGIPSRSRQSASSHCSVAVPRATAAGGGGPSMPSRSARPTRCSLPVGPLGMVATKANRRGTLKSAIRSATKASRSAAPTARPGRSTMAAPISSPSRGSANPNVTAWATAGCSSRISSTSRGEIFSPPRLMISLDRPARTSAPSPSRRPRSPVRNQPSTKAAALASGASA